MDKMRIAAAMVPSIRDVLKTSHERPVMLDGGPHTGVEDGAAMELSGNMPMTVSSIAIVWELTGDMISTRG